MHGTPAIARFSIEILGITKSPSYNEVADESLTTMIRGESNEKC
jgi:hypothetical protein